MACLSEQMSRCASQRRSNDNLIAEVSVLGLGTKAAHFHSLVAVAISALSELLLAVLARERSEALVRPHVVLHIAQF